MEAVTSAGEAHETAQGACAELSSDDVSDELQKATQQCGERAAALDALVATGTEVNSDWAMHREMMRTKDEADPQAYRDRWQSMVQAAPDNMKPYEDDAERYEAAPTCPSA